MNISLKKLIVDYRWVEKYYDRLRKKCKIGDFLYSSSSFAIERGWAVVASFPSFLPALCMGGEKSTEEEEA